MNINFNYKNIYNKFLSINKQINFGAKNTNASNNTTLNSTDARMDTLKHNPINTDLITKVSKQDNLVVNGFSSKAKEDGILFDVLKQRSKKDFKKSYVKYFKEAKLTEMQKYVLIQRFFKKSVTH